VKGTNVITLNTAMMIEIVQMYFDQKAPDLKVKVTNVVGSKTSTNTFDIVTQDSAE
jgi:hypothetical protein